MPSISAHAAAVEVVVVVVAVTALYAICFEGRFFISTAPVGYRKVSKYYATLRNWAMTKRLFKINGSVLEIKTKTHHAI